MIAPSLGLLMALSASPVPLVELGAELLHDTVTVRQGDVTLGQDDSATLGLGATLGLDYPLPLTLGDEPLRGTSTLGLAVGSARGDGRLVVGQELTWPAWAWGPWGARLGLGAQLELGLASDASSRLVLSLRAAVSVGPVELAWAPALVAPLASRARGALGAEVSQGPALELAPLVLGLRVYLDVL